MPAVPRPGPARPEDLAAAYKQLLAVEDGDLKSTLDLRPVSHSPDLFWAVRGGGGNFGVAIRFHYRSVSVTQVYGGALHLAATPGYIERVATAAVAADDNLTVVASVMTMPPLQFVPVDPRGRRRGAALHLRTPLRRCRPCAHARRSQEPQPDGVG